MKRALISISAAALAYTAISSNVHSAPAKEAVCRTCHGAGGAAPIAPMYPKLNGQNKVYLVNSMKAYKSGERKGTFASIMAGQVAPLSEAEIDELADYYSKYE